MQYVIVRIRNVGHVTQQMQYEVFGPWPTLAEAHKAAMRAGEDIIVRLDPPEAL
jgi:hypothetical protein